MKNSCLGLEDFMTFWKIWGVGVVKGFIQSDVTENSHTLNQSPNKNLLLNVPTSNTAQLTWTLEA